MRHSLKVSSLFLTLIGLSACYSAPQVQNQPLIQPVNQPVLQAPSRPIAQADVKVTQTARETIFDLGDKVSKASFSFTVNLAAGAETFATKASSSGRARKQGTDVTQFKLHLLDVGSAPTFDQVFDQTSAAVKFSSGLIAKTGTTQTFTFKNVPATALAGANHYFVAIQAHDATTNITNDTFLSAAQITGLPAGEQNRILIDPDGAGAQPAAHAYRSNGGGDTGMSGGVQVDPAFTIVPAQQTQLTTFLRVWDVQGATVDSQVTVNDGSAAYSGSINVQ